jgi:hypothetical protein
LCALDAQKRLGETILDVASVERHGTLRDDLEAADRFGDERLDSDSAAFRSVIGDLPRLVRLSIPGSFARA